METYKITLKSGTAFFRNEVTCTSVQESLNCPPLSTIHGLIAAAYGEYRYDIDIGYFFEFQHKCTDFELVMTENESYKDRFKKYINDERFDRNDILRGCFGTVPVRREVLFNCKLVLYLSDKDIANSFISPYYALALGRLEDLAFIFEKPKKIDVVPIKKPVRFGKTIIPFSEGQNVPGRITKLNVQISDSNPRKINKAGIYNIVDKFWENIPLNFMLYYDPDEDLGVYFHKGSKDV
jgi:CRISPR-associated protein Cas5t